MRTLALPAVALAAAVPIAASAAHRNPGLWEVTSQMNFTQGGPQIPPAVLAQMKARGIQMPDWNAPHTHRHCLTPQEAAKDEHPDFGQDKDCRVQNAAWSGDQFHADIVCSGPRYSGHGTIDGALSGGENYAGTIHVDGNSPQLGGHFVMDGRLSGKWLSADCGKGND